MKKLLIIVFIFISVEGFCSSKKMQIEIGKSNFYGKVIRVLDGDTLICLKFLIQKEVDIHYFGSSRGESGILECSTNYCTNYKEIEIDLYGIDCPELDQPYGTKAKTFISNLLFNEIVKVESYDKGIYGKLNANIITTNVQKAFNVIMKYLIKELIINTNKNYAWVNVEKVSINESLISQGLAWVNGQSCNKDVCNEWKKLQAEAKKKKIGLWSQPNPIPPWEWRKREIQKLLYEGIKLYRDGKKDKAIKSWERVLKYDPDNKQAEKYIKQAEFRDDSLLFEEKKVIEQLMKEGKGYEDD